MQKDIAALLTARRYICGKRDLNQLFFFLMVVVSVNYSEAKLHFCSFIFNQSGKSGGVSGSLWAEFLTFMQLIFLFIASASLKFDLNV